MKAGGKRIGETIALYDGDAALYMQDRPGGNPGMRDRLGDDSMRHSLTKAKLYSTFDNEEMPCVYVIEIYTRVVVDFFRSILSRY